MPNVGGPAQSKRQLLMSVVHSWLLYGAQVWADSAYGTEKAKSLLLQAQRCAALRVARCYRSMSDMAELLLAQMLTAPFLALERKTFAESKKAGSPSTKSDLRRETIRKWQSMWQTTTKAKWTRRIIPDVVKWWYHGPKSVSYHMSQAFSGHGCFQAYLSEKAIAASPACMHCLALHDDAEHTLFNCPFWDEARLKLLRSLGRLPRPEDVADLLCVPGQNELPTDPQQRSRILEAAVNNALLFTEMVEDILSQKESLKRMRQKQGPQNLRQT